MSKKKLPISKRSVIIASILVLAIGIPAAFLLFSNNSEDSSAWYSSSWLYRRSIDVANAGGTLTNEDVLIVYDTATLITGGKLQSDCDDLRFIDSDDSTALSYWIEGGCNTSTTHIWVRIPTLNSGGETIYMYYGNASATNSEQTWTGKFYLTKTSACDSGWTTESNSGGDFYLKFPRAASTFGTTGGVSSHNHGSASLTTSSVLSGTNNNSSGALGVTDGHTHSVSVPIDTNSSVLPTYLDMLFCSNNDLIVKQNMVTLFDATAPSGFTRFSALDSAFPRGNSSYSGTQGGSSTHSHTTTSADTGAPSATLTCTAGASNIASSIHTHTFSASTTDSGNNVPEYISAVYGQADADIMAPTGTIVMSNGTPPLGWSSASAFTGYFPYGASAYSATPGGTATHTHGLSLTGSSFTADVGCGTANPKTSKPATHSHTASGTSSSYSNNPPYVETIFIKKKTSQTVTINNEQTGNVAPDAPSSLLTEGTTNPTAVTDLTPEFSAIFTDSNAGDTGIHYEIEVNTNNTFSGTVMWDTGQVSTGPITNGVRSADISYSSATQLTKNGTTYYWRIRFWDDGGLVSDWTTAQFTMATNTTPNAPSSLQTESATNPGNVTDTTPEFSAIFSDTDSGDTGENYEIEVNTNNTFTGTVMWDSNKTSVTSITNGSRSPEISYGNPTPLALDGTTYYWRIRFWDASDVVSDWSSTAQFTMSGPPNAPSSLLTEAATDPTGVTDTTPEFSAVFSDPNTSDTGNYYEIEVNTASNFGGTVMWDSTQLSTGPITNGARSSDFTYDGLTLTKNGTTYYWRIRFWDSTGLVGNWSSTAQFTMYSNTTPNAPTSLYAEGASNPDNVADTTPEFSAVFSDPDPLDTGTYYEIEVNTNNTFSGTVMWDTTQLATGPITNGARSSDFIYDGLTLSQNGSTYYWRIRFWDDTGAVSNWSSTAQFTMAVAPNAPSSLLTEGTTNPTSVLDTTPEFSAIFTDSNSSDTGTYYEIEVNTNNTFSGTVMWDTTQLATGPITNGARSLDFIYDGLTLTQNATTYYWRIRFWDSTNLVSNWSSTAQFTMAGAPYAPSSPYTEGSTNPTKVTDPTPEFSAVFSDPNGSDTGAHYEIEVNTNNTFTGTVMWDSGQVATGPITNGSRSSDFSYPSGTPLALDGTTYYWRIRFWDNTGLVGNWSSTAQFTMSGPPYAPSSLLTEGSTNPTGVIDTTPEFSAIHTDPNADSTASYEIEVNTASNFGGTVMWDSNQQAITIVNGARSADISYAGTTLIRNGTTYYWRIRYWDTDTNVSNWSSTAQFTMYNNTTPNAPSTPYTEGATNPTKVTDTTPEFSAIFSDTDAGDVGLYYEIEVNTNNTFTGTVMWDTNKLSTGPITNGARSSDFSYPSGTPLPLDGTTYYWRIRFWDDTDAVSNWSATSQFTMSGPPNAPSNLFTEGTTNPTGVADLTPEFSAIHTDPNADSTASYEIEVNTASNFGGTVMWDSNQQAITVVNGARSADISYAGTPLVKNGTTYYWRIRFWDTDTNVSNWSSTAQFTMYSNTTPNAPSSPLAEAATNPDNVTDTTPEFSAIFSDTDATDVAPYYEIEVNTNNTFTGTVMWDSDKLSIGPITNGQRSTDIPYAGTPLTYNGTIYYWRMRFWDDSDYVSNWSSTAQFKMSGPPNAPSSLLTEGSSNPSGVTDLTPEFSAIFSDTNTGDTGNYYEIEVNTASNFSGTVMWDSNKLSTGPITNGARSSDFSYAGTTLSKNGTTYYWRIRFWDAIDNVSNWSSTAQFTMETNVAPNAPTTLYAEGSSSPTKVTDTTPEFSAIFSDSNGSDTGEHYEIEVNTDSDFTGTVMWDSGQVATSSITNGARSSDFSYPSGTPLPLDGATYYWRIRFWDDSGSVSNWSSTAQFRMSGPPSVPSSTLVDGMNNPLQILSLTPKFSALHVDGNGDNAVYYEVEVNSNNTFTGTVMWDSGKTAMTSTASGQYTPDISYNGTALTGVSSITYYWRIRLWDTDDYASEWSTTASFVDYKIEFLKFDGVNMEGVKIN